MDPISLLQQHRAELTKAEVKLADYILENPRCVIQSSLAAIAKEAGSSNAAFVRLCQKLGYGGFSEFKYSINRYLLSHGAAAAEGEPDSLQKLITTYTDFFQQIPNYVTNEELHRAAKSLCEAKRITIWGVNRTALPADQLAKRLGRIGIFNKMTDDWVTMSDDADTLAAGDLCVLFTVAGRGYANYEALLRTLKTSGCGVLVITMNNKLPLARQAGQVITLPWISHANQTNFFEDQLIFYMFIELLLYEVAKIYPG